LQDKPPKSKGKTKMIFRIENLGIIGKAEVDLNKDLILLCGHNNTGKSYLAYAIYHLLTMKHEYSLTKASLTDINF
jgi:pantothenate kinase-related protein Tda10